jgi:DNA-binding PadR family transcriptional regulator
VCGKRDDWGFGAGFPFGEGGWSDAWRGARIGAWGRGPRGGPRGGRRRAPLFESGEMKFVILRLLKEQPRHGYEVIRALEEKLGGYYTPSAGTVYPTLQLLEDEGYVRVVETEGKKVYHVTPEGERYLEEHRDFLEEILDRVRETVREFTGGGIGEVREAFTHLAGVTFRRAWRRGPDDPALRRVAEILRKAADEIEQAWQPAPR